MASILSEYHRQSYFVHEQPKFSVSLGDQILFLLAGLGVFNGLLLSIYFISVKPRKWYNLLFSILLLMLCVRIGKSLFFLFADISRTFRQVGLSACVLIGPALYLYLKNIHLRREKITKTDLAHLIITALFVIVVGIIWPYEHYPDFWNQRMVLMIYGIWVIYMLASTFVVSSIVRDKTVLDKILRRWMLLVYGGVMVLCIAYVLAYFGFPYLAGPLLFSVILYAILFYLATKENRNRVLGTSPIKYANRVSSMAGDEVLLSAIEDLMKEDQLYLDHDLKLQDVSTSTGYSVHAVSRVINSRLGLSFNKYVNGFRVDKACRLLLENDLLSVEGIAQEVGFNSKTTFYTAFKEKMQLTPAQYKKLHSGDQ